MPRRTTVTPIPKKGLYFCSNTWHEDGPPEARYYLQGMHPHAIEGTYRVDTSNLADTFSVCEDPVHIVRAISWMMARYRRVSIIRVDI